MWKSKHSVRACAVLLGLLLVTVTWTPVQAHESTCRTTNVTEEILLRSAVADRGSASEYVQVLIMEWFNEGGKQALNDTTNGLDAYIYDIGCHSTGLFAELAGKTVTQFDKVQMRYYDHLGHKRGGTDCKKSFSGDPIPDLTQYVAVVACGAAPVDVDINGPAVRAIQISLTVKETST